MAGQLFRLLVLAEEPISSSSEIPVNAALVGIIP